MKVVLSHSKPELQSHSWIQDINTLDTIVDNSEATEIIVDNFLSSFNFDVVGHVVSKIVSKLRISGEVIFYVKDISLICHNVDSMGLEISEINKLFFEDSANMSSVLNIENVCDLLEGAGLKVHEKYLNVETCQGIVKARRIINVR